MEASVISTGVATFTTMKYVATKLQQVYYMRVTSTLAQQNVILSLCIIIPTLEISPFGHDNMIHNSPTRTRKVINFIWQLIKTRRSNELQNQQ